MQLQRMNDPKPKTSAPSPRRKRPADQAFDTWLNRGLHRLYDQVAQEPVPEDLLKLIEEHRDK